MWQCLEMVRSIEIEKRQMLKIAKCLPKHQCIYTRYAVKMSEIASDPGGASLDLRCTMLIGLYIFVKKSHWLLQHGRVDDFCLDTFMCLVPVAF
jgi:hypothetical protein